MKAFLKRAEPRLTWTLFVALIAYSAVATAKAILPTWSF